MRRTLWVYQLMMDILHVVLRQTSSFRAFSGEANQIWWLLPIHLGVSNSCKWFRNYVYRTYKLLLCEVSIHLVRGSSFYVFLYCCFGRKILEMDFQLLKKACLWYESFFRELGSATLIDCENMHVAGY